jgi:uncharacterized protein
VKWSRGTRNDDVVDVRGRTGGTGARLGAGGIAVLLVAYLVSSALGVDLTGLVTSNSSTQAPQPEPQAPTGPDPDAELVDFIRDVMKDIQDTWTTTFEASGQTYRRAKLYLFTERITTRCGNASSAIGPFYCPGDESAYIDLSFYKALRERFGADGDFAQVYVLAHEIGHHVQHLLDAERRVRRARPKETDNQRSVRIELQADCYAGVWAYSARQRDKLERGDLEEALTAAAAIGDDRLQQQAGRPVNPETFSHGTSAQRVRWFRRGFDRGDPEACDTFTQEP